MPTSAAVRFDRLPEEVDEIVRLSLALHGVDAVSEELPIARI